MSGQIVSASAFVRNFGAYSRTAASEPVHILHHGKAVLSLIATEHLRRLSNSRTGYLSKDRASLELVIDGMSVHVVITDPDLNVLCINPAARHACGIDSDRVNVPLSSLLGPPFEFILRAAERVRDSGMTETLEADTLTQPVQTFRVKIENVAGGVSIVSEEITAQSVAREQHEAVVAYDKLIDSLPGLARGTINHRGLISSTSSRLAEMIQSDTDRLVGTRLSAIFDVSARSKVTDAVEALLSDQKDFSFPTLLHTASAGKVPVVITAVSRQSRRGQAGVFLLSEYRE
ncbi:MAG TPA: hypothetical protein VF503_19430 [Sphingobium sp.]|uniref:hypothetical protein n=1 Tax=Sphingobium sp. TaxID=1912891 RepID=UPI002ED04BBF